MFCALLLALAALAGAGTVSAQTFENLPFESDDGRLYSVDAATGGALVFRVEVPEGAIGWQLTTRSVIGNPDLYVRRGSVPQPNLYDAASLAPPEFLSGTIPGKPSPDDSVLLAPPLLTAGAWFVVVASEQPFGFTIESGLPEIVEIPFDMSAPLAIPAADHELAGPRVYRLAPSSLADQETALGWEIEAYVEGDCCVPFIRARKGAIPYSVHSHGVPRDSTYSVADIEPGAFHQQIGMDPGDWYVTIGTIGGGALGRARLQSRDLPVEPLAFDGGVAEFPDSPTSGPARMLFFSVDVPAAVEGWALRFDRDAPSSSTDGVTIGRGRVVDYRARIACDRQAWSTGCTQATNQGLLVISGGATLPADRYYITARSDIRGTIRSAGIGGQCPDGSCELPVTPLAFLGGSEAASLPDNGMGLRVYRVDVPADRESFYMKLETTVGDADMVVGAGGLPQLTSSFRLFDHGGRYQRASAGDDFFLRLADERLGQTRVPEGAHYVLVRDRPDGAPRTSASFRLTSVGELPETDLGTLSAGAVLTVEGEMLRHGEPALYAFDLPDDALIALDLDPLQGVPLMSLGPATDPGIPRVDFTIPPFDYREDNETEIGGARALASGPFQIAGSLEARRHRLLVIAGEGRDAHFDLTARRVIPDALDFDSGTTALELSAMRARILQVDVPADAEGWLLDIDEVVGPGVDATLYRGDIGEFDTFDFSMTCSFAIRHDVDPPWQPGCGLNLKSLDKGLPTSSRKLAVLPMGRPLMPGRYTLFLRGEDDRNDPAQGTSAVLRSRGIGQSCGGQACAIQPVALVSDSGADFSLPRAGDLAAFRMTVPPATQRMSVRLRAVGGDPALYVARGRLPLLTAGSTSTSDGFGGAALRNGRGDEYYYRYAYEHEAEVPPGDYLAFAFAMSDATQARAEFTAPDPVADLGTLDLSEPLELPPITVAFGQQDAIRFTVPEGLERTRIRVLDVSGRPVFTVIDDDGSGRLPELGTGDRYGAEEGGRRFRAASFETAREVEGSGPKLLVFGGSIAGGPDFPDSSFTLEFSKVEQQVLAFNGGQAQVVDQPTGALGVFRVEVPPGVLGWQLRVTSVSGRPQNLMIRRDIPPTTQDFGADSCNGIPFPRRSTSWPTACGYSRSMSVIGPTTEVLATGRALEPGTYFVGVQSSFGSATSYAIESHGIGESCDGSPCDIPVIDLEFGAPPVSQQIDRPYDIRVYRTEVPEDADAIFSAVSARLGNMSLSVNAATLPISGGNGFDGEMSQGGGLYLDTRDDEFVYRAGTASATLPAGTYYAIVQSQGQDDPASAEGTGPVLFNYTPFSPFPAVPIEVDGIEPTVVNVGNIRSGEYRAFDFDVPESSDGLRLELSAADGSARFSVVSLDGDPLPWPFPPSGSIPRNFIGGGGGDDVTGTDELDIFQPGRYRVLVSFITGAGEGSIELRLVPQDIPVVAFDGGRAEFDLPSNSQRFFAVDVPDALGDEPVLGWTVSGADGVPIGMRAGQDLPRYGSRFNGPQFSMTNYMNVLGRFAQPGRWYVRIENQQPNRDGLPAVVTSEALRPKGTLTLQANQPHLQTFASAADGRSLGEGELHLYRLQMPAGVVDPVRIDALFRGTFGSLEIVEDPVGGGFGPHADADQVVRSFNVGGGARQSSDFVPLPRRFGDSGFQPGSWWLLISSARGGEYELAAGQPQVRSLAATGDTVDNVAIAPNGKVYFRFDVPDVSPDATSGPPAHWTLRLAGVQGQIKGILRSLQPPGAASRGLSYAGINRFGSGQSHWGSDSIFALDGTLEGGGAHELALPPLVPGAPAWIALYADQGGASLDLSLTPSIARADPVTTIPYEGGVIDAILAPGERRVWRTRVPADASRWLHDLKLEGNLLFAMDRETIPFNVMGGVFVAPSHGTGPLVKKLRNQDGTPIHSIWRPGQTYYMLVENPGPDAARVILTLDGRRLGTDDADEDGFFDGVEYAVFGSLDATPEGDEDGDGFTNAVEVENGSDPLDAASVPDLEPPLLEQPGTLVLEAAGPDGTPSADPAVAAFLAGIEALDAIDGDVPVAADLPARFPLGASSFGISATDAAGNVSSTVVDVSVVDTTPPVILVPDALLVEAPAGTLPLSDPALAPVAEALALDAVDGELPVGSDAPAEFALGTTLVTLQAEDAAGNAGTRAVSVTLVENVDVQLISPDPLRLVLEPGAVASIALRYDTADGDAALDGLGLRLHYDSTMLNDPVTPEVLSAGFVGQGIEGDAGDADADPDTDSVLVLDWSAPGAWPGAELPVQIATIEVTLRADAPRGRATHLRIRSTAGPEGIMFRNASVRVRAGGIFDFDGDGSAQALSDGLLLLRYLFGFRGEAMVAGAVSADATLTTEQIVERLDELAAFGVLDVDGNGENGALTDGLLSLRYFFGFRGDTLVNGAIGSGAVRDTATQVETELADRMP